MLKPNFSSKLETVKFGINIFIFKNFNQLFLTATLGALEHAEAKFLNQIIKFPKMGVETGKFGKNTILHKFFD